LEETTHRTPDLSLKDTFLMAAAGLPGEDERAAVVGDALEYLQRGFDAHYAAGGARDDDILIGDNAYALAVETIARLDEPRFVAVASRMIRDGAGRVAEGGAVTVEMWTPHLAGLLDIISQEGAGRSEARIRRAAEELRDAGG
jgi:hypothetical protein